GGNAINEAGNLNDCLDFDTADHCISWIQHAVWITGDGRKIELINDPRYLPYTEYASFDGSFTLSTSRGVIYKDGVTANVTQNSSGLTGQTLTDTNGNSISCTLSQGAITGCTDTVGRHISFTTDASSGVPLSMTYLDSSGTSRSITFQYTT